MWFVLQAAKSMKKGGNKKLIGKSNLLGLSQCTQFVAKIYMIAVELYLQVYLLIAFRDILRFRYLTSVTQFKQRFL